MSHPHHYIPNGLSLDTPVLTIPHPSHVTPHIMPVGPTDSCTMLLSSGVSIFFHTRPSGHLRVTPTLQYNYRIKKTIDILMTRLSTFSLNSDFTFSNTILLVIHLYFMSPYIKVCFKVPTWALWTYNGGVICTVSVLIAAHVPISAHPSYFEVINHKIINHLPRSIHKAYHIDFNMTGN